MENNIKQAATHAIRQFEDTANAATPDFTALVLQVFDSGKPFLDKVAGIDEAFAANPEYESLHEVFFDLLLINFFSEDVNKLEKDYLESEEWESIEEDTIDRGTELLNLLLYLKECHDEEIEPQLSDYLQEFLLVDDDEFQDEHRIYEAVIENQVLMEGTVADVAAAANNISDGSELKELFYPVMCFFMQPKPGETEFDEFVLHSANPAFDTAIYRLLISYNQNQHT